MSKKREGLLPLILFGALSALLYFLLYLYSDVLLDLAVTVREGEKLFFLVPIIVALIFSFVHGSFTGRFWSYLGLEAKAGDK